MPVGGGARSAGDGSWYMPLDLGGISMDFLVDSGANPNLLSYDAFTALPLAMQSLMSPISTTIVAANDEFITTYGQITLRFTSKKGPEFETTFIVAEIGPIHGILGMRFLRAENASLDFASGVLCCGQYRLQLEPQSFPVFTVRMGERATIERDQGVLVSAVIEAGICEFPESEWSALVECQSLREDLIIPRCVVKVVKDGDQHVVRLPISNYGTEDIVLDPGEAVGRLEVVESIQAIQRGPGVQGGEPDPAGSAVPPHLSSLSQSAGTDLSKQQQKEVD